MPRHEKRNASLIQVSCVVATIASTAGGEVGVGKTGFSLPAESFQGSDKPANDY
jgi:hypothetical protein